MICLNDGNIMNNNVKDLGPSSKKGYHLIQCSLCNDTRLIYKYDIDKLQNGCNQCHKNVFNQVASNLNIEIEEDYKYYYSRYKAFIRRCYDRGQKQYINYGARGIIVCREWKGDSNFNLDTHPQSFKTWLEWFFNNEGDCNLTMDRINSNNNYSPSNCRLLPLELQQESKSGSLNNLSRKSSIYEGVCKNKNHYMVFYWDKINNKSITISNKKSNIDEIECALEYDKYLINKGEQPVNRKLINASNKIKYLFDKQDALNTSINSNWKNEGLNFNLYSQVESIEGIQSFNFKHWKKDKNDFKNAEMEMIDVIFFTISECIKSNIDYSKFTYLFKYGIDNNANSKTPEQCIKLFQDINYYSCNNNLFNVIICLGYLADTLGYTIEDIYIKYVGKEVLNIFRQDHGYKTGEYIKQWKSSLDPNGLIEDNVYLEMFMDDAAKDQPDNMYDYLYNKLEVEYANNI